MHAETYHLRLFHPSLPERSLEMTLDVFSIILGDSRKQSRLRHHCFPPKIASEMRTRVQQLYHVRADILIP